MAGVSGFFLGLPSELALVPARLRPDCLLGEVLLVALALVECRCSRPWALERACATAAPSLDMLIGGVLSGERLRRLPSILIR